MLTRKQSELLAFIAQYQDANGYSPSFEQMKDALGLKSKSGVARLADGLEERGFITRKANRRRAIQILSGGIFSADGLFVEKNGLLHCIAVSDEAAAEIASALSSASFLPTRTPTETVEGERA